MDEIRLLKDEKAAMIAEINERKQDLKRLGL
jgi:hypothetical protein